MSLWPHDRHSAVSTLECSALGDLLCGSVRGCLKVGCEVSPSAGGALWRLKELISESIAFSCSEHTTHTRTLSSEVAGSGGKGSHDIT